MGDVAQVDITTPVTTSEAPVVASSRPANIPEKFWDESTKTTRVDDLAASYAELSAKLGAKEVVPEVVLSPEEAAAKQAADLAALAAAEAAKTPEEKAAAEAASEADKAAAEAAKSAGLDLATLETKFAEAGKLDDTDYEALATAGIPKNIVDEFIELRSAAATTFQTELLAPVGGTEGYEKAIKWASENWTADQIKQYDASITSADKARMKMAMTALTSDFKKATGSAPKLLTPTAPASSDGNSYKTMTELTLDQAKPEYRTNPAFREAVIAKLARSNI